MRPLETFVQALPHGIELSCRACGERGRPVLMFLHGFPEGAFIWDSFLQHFAESAQGGYRCIAPNLRGFERSSAPTDVKAYRPKFLLQDIEALIAAQGGALECLVAHDWGGAVAWNLANQLPHLAHKLTIINSPHPGTFLRDLQSNPAQQTASAYMNFLIRPDAETLLAQDDYRRLWEFFTGMGTNSANPTWLSPSARQAYRQLWQHGLTGGCNYYRASPLRPPRPADPAAANVVLPRELLTVDLPTLVIWGMQDLALPPTLLKGLDAYVRQLQLHTIEDAGHWVVHEHPQRVMGLLAEFLRQPAA